MSCCHVVMLSCEFVISCDLVISYDLVMLCCHVVKRRQCGAPRSSAHPQLLQLPLLTLGRDGRKDLALGINTLAVILGWKVCTINSKHIGDLVPTTRTPDCLYFEAQKTFKNLYHIKTSPKHTLSNYILLFGTNILM